MLVRDGRGQAQLRGEVREVVVAVRGPVEEAACGSACRAIVARVAGEHLVVVVVVHILQARLPVTAEALRERLLDLSVQRRDLALHVVVVVLARRANCIRGRRAVGRRSVLRLLQEAVGELEVDAREILMSSSTAV